MQQTFSEIPSLLEFEKMLDRHDWTYYMSDDFNKYRQGQEFSRFLEGVLETGGPEYQKMYREKLKYYTTPREVRNGQ